MHSLSSDPSLSAGWRTVSLLGIQDRIYVKMAWQECVGKHDFLTRAQKNGMMYGGLCGNIVWSEIFDSNKMSWVRIC